MQTDCMPNDVGQDTLTMTMAQHERWKDQRKKKPFDDWIGKNNKSAEKTQPDERTERQNGKENTS